MDVSETLTLTEVTQPSRVYYVYIMCILCVYYVLTVWKVVCKLCGNGAYIREYGA